MTNVSTAVIPNAQENINGRLYRHVDLVHGYTTTKLYPSEATVFVRYRDDIVHKRVLDLGCGAGRLAVYLRPLTEGYLGIDVSSHMVSYCRRTYPDQEFHQDDMRQLTHCADGSVDTVLAVSNLIDAVCHEDRLLVLAKVRRILSRRGLFFFSSHNRRYVQAGTGPKLEFHRNPVTQVRLFADYLQARLNHRKNQALQRAEADYALINDSGNNYRNLHYYIDRDVQAKQLSAAGFELCECLDPQGVTLQPHDDDRDCPSVHYVARRRDE